MICLTVWNPRKMSKVAKNMGKWPKMSLSGQKSRPCGTWPKKIKSGQIWANLATSGQQRQPCCQLFYVSIDHMIFSTFGFPLPRVFLYQIDLWLQTSETSAQTRTYTTGLPLLATCGQICSNLATFDFFLATCHKALIFGHLVKFLAIFPFFWPLLTFS